MHLRKLLEELLSGRIDIDEAERRLRLMSYEELKHSMLDINREARAGAPEAVLAEHKSTEALLEIAETMLEAKGRCILTRLRQKQAAELEKRFRGRVRVEAYPEARMVVLRRPDFKPPSTGGRVGVVCAGTSDIPVAREAEVIAREMGCRTWFFSDVGIAGLHRLLPVMERLAEVDPDAIVVAAGMEGALPGVVAGLVEVPVIGLPVSTGYGLRGRGETALFTMLHSCSPGIAVVNIDNGFGAGVLAALIANRAARFREG
ncbi:MAG: nickel pincer cofactor biosynthesis protein LarB [Euryarchaeota archaeon]|nr:nickel pincer cofactor biosynthesis protein LarB [Euryarchaeota archaeon]